MQRITGEMDRRDGLEASNGKSRWKHLLSSTWVAVTCILATESASMKEITPASTVMTTMTTTSAEPLWLSREIVISKTS